MIFNIYNKVYCPECFRHLNREEVDIYAEICYDCCGKIIAGKRTVEEILADIKRNVEKHKQDRT